MPGIFYDSTTRACSSRLVRLIVDKSQYPESFPWNKANYFKSGVGEYGRFEIVTTFILYHVVLCYKLKNHCVPF